MNPMKISFYASAVACGRHGCALLTFQEPAAQQAVGAHRHRQLSAGGRHGRRSRHRQEGRRPHRHDGRHRRAGALQLSGQPARAGPLLSPDPRRRLRRKRPADSRRRRRQDGEHRSQTDEDGQSRAAHDERRMVDQHAGHRRSKGVPAGLRRLPHGRAHRHIGALSRSVHGDHSAHGHVCAGQSAETSAEASARPAGQPRHRRPRSGQARRQFSRERESLEERDVAVSTADIPASEGTRHARHHHHLRPGAPRGHAARRHRAERQGFLQRFRQPVHRRDGPEDRHDRRSSGPRPEARATPRSPRAEGRPRRQCLGLDDVPGRNRHARCQDQQR